MEQRAVQAAALRKESIVIITKAVSVSCFPFPIVIFISPERLNPFPLCLRVSVVGFLGFPSPENFSLLRRFRSLNPMPTLLELYFPRERQGFYEAEEQNATHVGQEILWRKMARDGARVVNDVCAGCIRADAGRTQRSRAFPDGHSIGPGKTRVTC